MLRTMISYGRDAVLKKKNRWREAVDIAVFTFAVEGLDAEMTPRS